MENAKIEQDRGWRSGEFRGNFELDLSPIGLQISKEIHNDLKPLLEEKLKKYFEDERIEKIINEEIENQVKEFIQYKLSGSELLNGLLNKIKDEEVKAMFNCALLNLLGKKG